VVLGGLHISSRTTLTSLEYVMPTRMRFKPLRVDVVCHEGGCRDGSRCSLWMMDGVGGVSCHLRGAHSM
jgi:hypothetical protein